MMNGVKQSSTINKCHKSTPVGNESTASLDQINPISNRVKNLSINEVNTQTLGPEVQNLATQTNSTEMKDCGIQSTRNTVDQSTQVKPMDLLFQDKSWVKPAPTTYVRYTPRGIRQTNININMH